jgi:hypothetical protein
MYDLRRDPLETENIAFQIDKRPRPVQREFERLRRDLQKVKLQRLRPLH